MANFQQPNLEKVGWRLSLEERRELPSRRVKRKHLKKGLCGRVYKAIWKWMALTVTKVVRAGCSCVCVNSRGVFSLRSISFLMCTFFSTKRYFWTASVLVILLFHLSHKQGQRYCSASAMCSFRGYTSASVALLKSTSWIIGWDSIDCVSFPN